MEKFVEWFCCDNFSFFKNVDIVYVLVYVVIMFNVDVYNFMVMLKMFKVDFVKINFGQFGD